MRRKSNTSSSLADYKKYDFLAEVDGERLKLIGAIALAWNWIEGALDATLAMSLELAADMWVEVSSRINGIDGKTALIKRSLTLDNGLPKFEEDDLLILRKAINAIENNKRFRDGLIHARMIHPEAIISQTSQRKGVADEVLMTAEALNALYNLYAALGEEMDAFVRVIFVRLDLGGRLKERGNKLTEEHLRWSLAQLREAQTKREALPPLPEFPVEPQAPPMTEAAR